jgi:hypothetical protein
MDTLYDFIDDLKSQIEAEQEYKIDIEYFPISDFFQN